MDFPLFTPRVGGGGPSTHVVHEIFLDDHPMKKGCLPITGLKFVLRRSVEGSHRLHGE